MKSYTDIEQSKKLTEILPFESADMYFEPSTGFCTEPSEVRVGDIKYAHPRSIPCWSLVALLEILPDKVTINNEKYYLVFNKKVVEYRGPITWDGQKSISSEACNLIDACYEMILKLHEQNLI